jgi:hypothetical protein
MEGRVRCKFSSAGLARIPGPLGRDKNVKPEDARGYMRELKQTRLYQECRRVKWDHANTEETLHMSYLEEVRE